MLKRIYTSFALFVVLSGFCSSLLAKQSVITALINDEYANVPADVSVFAPNPNREIIDLNGEWEVRIGDGKKWQKVRVPSSLDFSEKLYFRKEFYLPADAGKYQANLIALGINYNCSIKLNGTFIGSHSSGYTSFEVEILDKLLKPGMQNLIEVEIDNSSSQITRNFLRPFPWGWKRYTGIIREIYIELTSKIAITEWNVRYDLSDDFSECNAIFTFNFRNYDRVSEVGTEASASAIRRENIQEFGYYIEIYNLKSNKLVKDNRANPKFINIHRFLQDTLLLRFRNVELWSPDNPVRYRLKVTLIQRNNIPIDHVESTFGFRDIKIHDNGIMLNGQNITLKGVYRIEQHPDYGVSLPWKIQKQDLQLIKDLGLNAVRSGPYPNHPYFYELSDQLGIMVLEEISVNQIPSGTINSQENVDYSLINLQEMIIRDRRHPSIIGWGLGSNLEVSSSNTASFISRLADASRRLDNRLVYYSSAMVTNDICIENADFKLLDFFSPELDKVSQVFTTLESEKSSNPVFIGRIGVAVDPDNSEGGYLDPTSLEYQAKYVTDLYSMVEESESVKGVFFWSFADWRGDMPVLASGPVPDNTIYHLGLLTENREHRLAYQHLNATLFNNKSLTLTSGSPNEDSQERFIFTGFVIIILLITALKQHKWFGQNFRRSLLFPKIFFEDIMDRRNIQNWQTIMLAFVVASSISLGIASLCYLYRHNIYFDLMISQFFLSKGLKNGIIYLIWHPVINIVVITSFQVLLMWIISVLHNIVMTFLGTNRGVSFSLNILVWSGSLLTFSLIFSIPLYSALQNAAGKTIYAIVTILFLIMYASRFMLALRISYQSYFRKSLFSFIMIAVVLFGGIGMFFQNQFQTFTYLSMYIETINSQLN